MAFSGAPEIINSRLFTTVRDSLGLTYDVSFEVRAALFERCLGGLLACCLGRRRCVFCARGLFYVFSALLNNGAPCLPSTPLKQHGKTHTPPRRTFTHTPHPTPKTEIGATINLTILDIFTAKKLENYQENLTTKISIIWLIIGLNMKATLKWTKRMDSEFCT